MRRRLFLFCTAIVAVCALLASSGAHWMALQSVAWTRMLLDYSRNGSVVVAVSKTFDGQHPCHLCSRVVEESGSERKVPASLDPAQKVSLYLAPRAVHVLLPPGADHDYPGIASLKPGDVCLDPPGPVPRLFVS